MATRSVAGNVLLALGAWCAAACGRFGFDEGAPVIDGPNTSDVPVGADAAGDGAPGPCDQQLFCDSFDSGLSQWDGVVPAGANVRHEPTFGRSGGSLHAIAGTNTQIAALYADLFPTLPADLYIRIFVFAPSGMLLDLEPLELSDVAATHQLVFSIYDNEIDIHAHAMANDFQVIEPTPMPRDRWVCMELHVRFAANGLVELFLDGTRAIVQSAVDTRPPSGDLSRMLVGIASKPMTIPGDVHVDDVAVATSPIGCN